MTATLPADPDSDEQAFAELVASIAGTPIAAVITNPRLPDNPIVAVNPAFERLTGYRADEAVGRNCRFLAGFGTEPQAQDRLRQAVAQAQPTLAEMTNFRKDGTPFRNAVMIAPVRGADGGALFFVGSQMEVPAGADAARRSAALARVGRLTPRQRQVLDRLIHGERNKQIAAALGIDEKTVKMHRAAMLERLGCATSADAIRTGVEAGLS